MHAIAQTHVLVFNTQVIDDPMGDKLLMVMEYVDGGALMAGDNPHKFPRVTEATARKHFRDVLKVRLGCLELFQI